MTFETALSIAGTNGFLQIVEQVAARCGCTVSDILGKSRLSHITKARGVCAWMLRQRNLSFPAIGRILHKDHTTIMYAVRNVERERTQSEGLARTLDALKGAA